MTVEEWFFGFLRSTASLQAVLGGSANFRLYPEWAPQAAAYPHGTYQVIDFPQEYHLEGPSGMAHPRIQLDWWSNRPGGRKEVLELVELTRNADGGNPSNGKLDGYAGVSNDLRIHKCELVNREFSSEPPVHANEHPFRRGSMDWIVWFREL